MQYWKWNWNVRDMETKRLQALKLVLHMIKNSATQCYILSYPREVIIHYRSTVHYVPIVSHEDNQESP